ncbi:unnamed protein product [Cercospora beticola]|nr:unnamed protein product [Cercospora beticola]
MKLTIFTTSALLFSGLTYGTAWVQGRKCCKNNVDKCVGQGHDGCVHLNYEYCVEEVNEGAQHDKCTDECSDHTRIEFNHLRLYRKADGGDPQCICTDFDSKDSAC